MNICQPLKMEIKEIIAEISQLKGFTTSVEKLSLNN